MSTRHPALRLVSYALPLLLVITGCAVYARLLSNRTPNGELRNMPSPVERGSERPLVRLEPLKTLQLPDSTLNLNGAGSVLYASMTTSGFVTIDISDPADPRLAEHMTLEGGPQVQYVLNAFRVGDQLLVLDRIRGIAVYDAKDPLHPVFQWSLQLPGGPRGQAVDLLHEGDYLYLACGGVGLAQIPANLTPESEPRYLLNRFDHTTDVEFMPPHWVVAADGRTGGLQIVNIEDPDAPRALGNIATWPLYMENLVIRGDHAFTSTRGDRVMLAFNLERPGRPYLSNYYRRTGSRIKAITGWDDRFVILGNERQLIEIFDARDAEAPRAIAEFPMSGRVYGLFVRDDILFVSIWGERRIEVFRLIRDDALEPSASMQS